MSIPANKQWPNWEFLLNLLRMVYTPFSMSMAEFALRSEQFAQHTARPPACRLDRSDVDGKYPAVSRDLFPLQPGEVIIRSPRHDYDAPILRPDLKDVAAHVVHLSATSSFSTPKLSYLTVQYYYLTIKRISSIGDLPPTIWDQNINPRDDSYQRTGNAWRMLCDLPCIFTLVTPQKPAKTLPIALAEE